MNDPFPRLLARPAVSRPLFRVFGIALGLFLVAIVAAAVLYAGGNRYDAEFPRFSLAGNFLCDLFHRDGYNRRPNPGRPFAMFAAYAFAVALVAYWNLLPRLFESRIREARAVRVLGSTAMTISFFVATPLHDLCVHTAIPLAVIAFLISIRALRKSGETALARLGVFSVAIFAVNYLSLAIRVFPAILPGLQKITLLVFLAWVALGAVRIRRASRYFSRASPRRARA